MSGDSIRATGRYASADGKPVVLAAIFDADDLARVKAAHRVSLRLLDGLSALLAPAGVYGAWLEELGLPDLAERARTGLAPATRAGDAVLQANELHMVPGRAIRA